MKKEFILVAIFFAIVFGVKDNLIRSSEDKVSMYQACMEHGGIKSTYIFGNEVLCQDKEKVEWK